MGRHAAPDISEQPTSTLTNTEPVLGADRVSYRRGGRSILDEVSVAVHPGEVLAVTGPSGSGKSSLLALLAGLEQPDSGRVFRTAAASERELGVPAGYGLVLQGYGLVSVLTAAENVEVVLQGGRLPRAELRDRAATALAEVGLAEVGDHLLEQLSGGQQQRVAIARALVIDPAVLLADELTAELDTVSRRRVLDRVFGLAERGSAVVVCTHDPELAAACTRAVRLTNGVLTGG